ncbi:cell surface protein SprA [Hymenobacter tibetensis]|uniref:Cell surface protein SprA n=1 Tax=Hymenobacter tibetensis TaxID=497967 RepID=A0ABY4CW70_9BACT|nr:cell surface protein SprA [Hymenobacter tibetensis]UOG74515.1 cell surface protein SprA [Hymenobacter tibetensis]
MNSGKKSLTAFVVVVASLVAWWSQAESVGDAHFAMQQLWASWLPGAAMQGGMPWMMPTPDTPRVVVPDTSRYRPSSRPKVRPADRAGTPFAPQRRRSPLILGLPSNINQQITPDDSLQNFDVQERVGQELDFRDPSRLSYKEYAEWQQRQAIRDYFRNRSAGGVTGDSSTANVRRLIPKIYLGPAADRIFGGSYVDIRPAGAVTLRMGARFNRNENPTLTLRQQRIGDFQFDQSTNLNLTGQIGEKLRLTFNYDTKAAFNFENNMKLDYTGFDTDIIRKIELGNVSLPLNNSLIQGGQNLFGVKTQLQFGRLSVTTVASNLRGQADEVRVQNGAQSRQFEIKASQYERDRHFFLSQFFRDRYNQALRNLPTVQSGVEIRRVEVYITNDNRQSDNLRNVVALMDLGEPRRVYRRNFLLNSPPATASNASNSEFQAVLSNSALARGELTVDNYLNTLPQQALAKNVDYEHVRARKLDAREYTFNAQLGYLSLNTPLLPEQVLSVSYEYLYNGRTYKVGELVDDYSNVGQDQVIFMKMLKATNPGVGLVNENDNSVNLPQYNPNPATNNPNLLTDNLPTWDLMMKNVYPLNASQLNRDNFQLQIIYKDDVTGVDLISLKEGVNVANRPLIEVLNLDNVNPNNDRNPDGNFDFFPGITIDPELGKIIFPVVEPFGSYLLNQFEAGTEQEFINRYVYQELYTQVQSDAQQRTEKDKFILRGRFQATATNEISLPGLGIAQGSVRVRAGSVLLEEGRDYQVFYDQAMVKILNPAYLNSANELRVEFEKNALVQVQPRRLLGVRMDYRLNSDVNFGATVLQLRENQAPGINRVNVGDEPGNNTIYGFDVNMRRDSRALTKYIDMLPMISTKEPSSVAFSGEFAQLLPGESKLGNGENGVSYLDDFENARTPYTLGGLNSAVSWRLGATPRSIPGFDDNTINSAFRRAKMAWYTIDQTYYTGGPSRPNNIGTGDVRNHYVRGIQRTEIFPSRDVGATGNSYEYSFDMAYYPRERGQYNYNPAAASGLFSEALAPQNYGAISREITFDTDFDNANVEYLEFWMLDPFLEGENGVINDNVNPATNNINGGKLLINLGSVSEDVLRDGNQYEFENGLPATDDPAAVSQSTRETAWGRVSRQQFLTDAFSSEGRDRQDIGLEGLSNTEEQQFFGAAYANVADPSADDFRHHLDPFYEQNDVKILGRYKQYNGLEGNSRANNQLSSTAFPDKEDLNRDNVISETERYYEYELDLRKGQLEVGSNYIVDKVTSTVNSEQVSWYQVRIPIRSYTRVQSPEGNTPFGFKSIRFLRMVMTDWREPVVLRMVQPQFIANQWRRYLGPISDPNVPCVNCNEAARAFNISTVSLEENGGSSAQGTVPYVLPPGIERDKEYGSSTVNRQQNEQSLRLCVEDLRDGFGQAAYKNLSLNLVRYKKLRMFLHAQSENGSVRDGEAQAFIRIGTDYNQNYYEYRLPLVVTPAGSTRTDDIWPLQNRVDIELQRFIDAKAERNRLANLNPAQASYIGTFTQTFPDGSSISVVGNPDISSVQGAMIGIFNPANDDRRKSLCLWADEMRVFDFDKENGWAATARFNTKLADVANITATGSYVSVGFGGLQDKLQQRSLEDITRGDINATVSAEKFFPERLGLRVPILVQAGHESRAPQYDPLDPDTKLDQSLRKFDNDADRAAYRKEVIDQTTSRSISVLNVRKERTNTERKPKPYDIENVALSYSYTERKHTDIRTDRDYTRTYNGALAYIYQNTPKVYTPLAKVKALDSPYLKFLQEVNFTPLPSRFSFRADIDRRYNERFLQRSLEPGTVPERAGDGLFLKSFFFNRIYDLQWGLTKALTLDYTANNRAVIDEGIGSTIDGSDIARRNREQLRENLFRRGGRTTNFNQTVALTYRLPLDKFPLTDWLTADTRYAANYTWQAASTALRAPSVTNPDSLTNLELGNTIQNNGELSANGKIDLVKLYNKVRFLNIINNAPPPGPANKPGAAAPGVGRVRDAGQAGAAPADTAKGPELRFLKAVLRSLMTARSLNFTFTRSNGTLLPGYLPTTRFFGLNSDWDAPGVPFLLGKSYDLNQLYQKAATNGWYTERSDLLNTPLSSLLTESFNYRTALEPFRDFNIQVEGRRQKVQNQEVFYRRRIDEVTQQPIGEDPLASNPLGSGSFSTSIVSIRTLFGDLSNEGVTSRAFNRFISNRKIVHDRLQETVPTVPFPLTGTPQGYYGYNSQDVLIPAFLDAYKGKSSDSYKPKKFNPFAQLPIPNWRVDYNGLAELPFVKRYFRSISLTHAYSSVYSVASYTTATDYPYEPQSGDPNNPFGLSFLTNASGQYIPYYVLGQVSIAERLTPLIGVNFQTLEKVTGRVEYRTERAVALNTTNSQVTELRTQELVIGFGYATNRLKLPFRIGGEQRVLKNELTARLDLSIRDNSTIQRTIEDVVDPQNVTSTVQESVGRAVSLTTNGTKQLQLRPTVDYVLNQRLNLQFFFTRTLTEPRVENSFRNSTTEGGIQLRYSLSQ